MSDDKTTDRVETLADVLNRELWKSGYIDRLDGKPRDAQRPPFYLKGWDDGEEVCK